MTVLAGACATALAATQTGAVQWLQPLDPVPAVADEGPVDETPQRWFVELTNAPTSEGGNAAQLRSEKQAFRDAARQAGVPMIEHYAFDGLFNGFSITVGRAHLSTLMRLPGVRALYPVETIQRPEPGQSDPEMATALAMTGADIAQNELGLDGTGVRVAVMDTGIDIDHPDFGGSGTDGTTPFPSARIVAGYDFVGDAFNADPSSPLYNPIPSPDGNPDDCGGHGTHVAGIVGANGTVKGVAPNVQFGAYRVFGCNGSTTSDIMLAAMERALADGMHVLNMSIGSTYQWPQYPTAKAASRLVNRRMVVVASAGNSGQTGVYSTGAPSVGEKVISVASFDNTHVRQPYFTVSPDAEKIGYNAATGAPAAPTSGTATLARTGTTASTADACNALPAGSLAGRVALIRRGSCTFHVKALNAQNAGAVGVVLYNNAPGAVNATVVGTPEITVPTVGVSDTAGALLDARIAAGDATLTWTDGVASFPNPAGGLLSSFTAYGMSPDLALKPDIGAPGGSIYSTYPLESGGFATLSGTSMAAPHVAGAAALLLQAEPRTQARKVGGILQNSAEPKVWSLNPGLGLLDVVHRQGAGMMQIDRAIVSAVRVEPAKISLGESEAGPVTRTLSIENTGDTPVTYALSRVDAVSTAGSTYAPTFFVAPSSVAFSASSVTVAPGATATVDVTIAAGAGAATGGQYGGYLVLTPDDGSGTLRVPYAGYVGDYQARPVMTPTAYGFPWLAKSSGGSYSSQPDGATYTLAGGDIPYFLVHLDHQSRTLRMDVVEAATGRVWRRAAEYEYLGRNSTPTGFFAYSWDGLVQVGQRTQAAPDGQYRMRLSVLKALGDPTNEAHWERWESPVITIAR